MFFYEVKRGKNWSICNGSSLMETRTHLIDIMTIVSRLVKKVVHNFFDSDD